jgi:hypothetical protein
VVVRQQQAERRAGGSGRAAPLQQDGTVTARTLLWREGMPSWRPLAELDPSVAAAGPVAQPPEPAGIAPMPAIRPIPIARPGGRPAHAGCRAGGRHGLVRRRGRRQLPDLSPALAAGSGHCHGQRHLALAGVPDRRDLDDVPQDVPAGGDVGRPAVLQRRRGLLGVPEGLSLVITFALSITAASLPTAGTWRTASA